MKVAGCRLRFYRKSGLQHLVEATSGATATCNLATFIGFRFGVMQKREDVLIDASRHFCQLLQIQSRRALEDFQAEAMEGCQDVVEDLGL